MCSFFCTNGPKATWQILRFALAISIIDSRESSSKSLGERLCNLYWTPRRLQYKDTPQSAAFTFHFSSRPQKSSLPLFFPLLLSLPREEICPAKKFYEPLAASEQFTIDCRASATPKSFIAPSEFSAASRLTFSQSRNINKDFEKSSFMIFFRV